MYGYIIEGHLLHAAETVESRGCESCTPGSESVSTFHLFHLFIDWFELVGFVVWCLLGRLVLCVFWLFSCCRPICAIELSTDNYLSTVT